MRYRRPVRPGDVIMIEAVIRLRGRTGLLKGIACVDGQRAVEGTMTFALGPAIDTGSTVARHLCCTAERRTGRGTRRAQEELPCWRRLRSSCWCCGCSAWSAATLGNFIYVLLVIAIILFLVRLVSGRRVV